MPSTRPSRVRPLALCALPLLLLVWPASRAPAATLTIVPVDGAGEGFNDPTPAVPVGGNPGTTVGAQRLYVFQYAADLWGSALPSNVGIRVQASFDPLTCTATSAVLGSAGPMQIFRDFPGAPRVATWYAVALANKLAGSDLSPGTNDIQAQFSSNLGQSGCLTGRGWYYGLDGNEGTNIELLAVVLHEFGHGLGFLSFVNLGTGALNGGFSDIFTHFILDDATGLHWEQMSAGQRVASAINGPNVVWDGPAVTQAAPHVLAHAPVLAVNSPPAIAGTYAASAASFGPALTTTGVTGDVVLVDDGVGTTSNGCEPLINGPQVSGKIALIDRGGCTFVSKVKNAQNAGAIAAIIADSLASAVPVSPGGSDPTITIPTIGITQANGNLLKPFLATGVNATLRADPTRLAGADASSRVLLYAPNPVQSGSSISHWDVSATPDLLMEPNNTAGIHNNLDLTIQLFQDIGWYAGAVDTDANRPFVSRLLGNAPNPLRTTTSFRFTLGQADDVSLDVYDVAGRHVAGVFRGRLEEGAHALTWNGEEDSGRRAAAGVYLYRLRGSGLSEARRLVVVR